MDEGDDITMQLERLSAIAPIPLQPSESVGLVVVAGPDAGRRIVFVSGASVGRAPESTLSLRDELVSRHHLRFGRETDGRCTAEDLGSRNGTLLNGSPLTRATVSFGDRIQIGATLLIFVPVDPGEGSVARPDAPAMAARGVTTGGAPDLDEAAQPPRAYQDDRRPRPGPRASTVLVAEPDPQLRRAFVRALTHAGHRVLVGADVETGLRICTAPDSPVDTVILDIDALNADEHVLTRLRSEAPRLRIVVLSTRHDTARAARLQRLGAAAVLDKPCGLYELMRAIALGSEPTTTTQ